MQFSSGGRTFFVRVVSTFGVRDVFTFGFEIIFYTRIVFSFLEATELPYWNLLACTYFTQISYNKLLQS